MKHKLIRLIGAQIYIARNKSSDILVEKLWIFVEIKRLKLWLLLRFIFYFFKPSPHLVYSNKFYWVLNELSQKIIQ